MITPDDFLSFAKKLATSKDEMDMRCSMSRAYYAIHHALFQAQEALSLPPGDGNSHDRIINAFLNSNDRALILIGTKAQQAKRLRVTADYRLNKTIPHSDVRAQIAKANNILSSLESILDKAS